LKKHPRFCSKLYNRVWPVVLLLGYLGQANAQVGNVAATQHFYDFVIDCKRDSTAANSITFLTVSKNGVLLFADTVLPDSKLCTGFSFPPQQPCAGYFIFSKLEKNNGKTYILNSTGGWAVIAGGSFWVAPKNKLLFILTQRSYSNLVVFDLKQMKTVLEKFNCDNFTNWYYYHGNYFGSVKMECGDEGNERELSKWMNATLVEEFDIKTRTLNETSANEGKLEKAKALLRYCYCQ
jgi:hypothetical protein